jgi:hypothetical protein
MSNIDNKDKPNAQLPTTTEDTEDLDKSITVLEKDTDTLVNHIIKENDVDSLKNLVHLFNIAAVKKDVIRSRKLDSLLDSIGDQMTKRFKDHPDEFSNSELLDYMDVTQKAIDRASQNISQVDTAPLIQLNQQNNAVNINVTNSLDREAKNRVIEAVKAILAADNKPKSATSTQVIDATNTTTVPTTEAIDSTKQGEKK